VQFVGEAHDTLFRKSTCFTLALAAGVPADGELPEPVLAWLAAPASEAGRATAPGLRTALAVPAAPVTEPQPARTARQASAAVTWPIPLAAAPSSSIVVLLIVQV